MYEFDTLLTTRDSVGRCCPFPEELLAAANRKRMGVIAMKVVGGGNGCPVTGSPFKKALRSYDDEISRQVDARSLIRHTLGLPISVAVIGVVLVDQLKEDVRIVREANSMTLTERQELEIPVG